MTPSRTSGAKNRNEAKDGATLGGLGTDLFPESIRIDFVMTCCKYLIDLGSLFCNLRIFVDGFAVALGTLFKQNLANAFS